ncbi:14338_t:CDS:2 [Entrophospora sp. SA101]|nr:14338_t:CDS:2 [Entrophospora sp. SA101]
MPVTPLKKNPTIRSPLLTAALLAPTLVGSFTAVFELFTAVTVTTIGMLVLFKELTNFNK